MRQDHQVKGEGGRRRRVDRGGNAVLARLPASPPQSPEGYMYDSRQFSRSRRANKAHIYIYILYIVANVIFLPSVHLILISLWFLQSFHVEVS